jgi:hypothetical protein
MTAKGLIRGRDTVLGTHRTRIAIQSPDRGEAAMEHVLALMEETLGWSDPNPRVASRMIFSWAE